MRRLLLSLTASLALVLPALASAHEVYVLTPGEIQSDVAMRPFNMLDVALGNQNQFLLWAFIAFVLVSTIFCISIFRVVEEWFKPFFTKIRPSAPLVCRITVGIGLLAGAYFGATYGPELPLSPVYGSLTPLVTGCIALSGILMLLGLYPRLAAGIALFFFAVAVWKNGIYMLTYANYFGEFIVLFLVGASGAMLSRKKIPHAWQRIKKAVEPYEFPIIRICFGISLLYAAIYAKMIHNALALQVATEPLAGHPFGVAHYLGFEPHFLVLGAAIVETVLAFFFIFGIEIRWSCIFLEFWLSLSLWWFGESVWPHLILIGIPIALFMNGYDDLSIEGRFFRKRGLEPVL